MVTDAQDEGERMCKLSRRCLVVIGPFIYSKKGDGTVIGLVERSKLLAVSLAIVPSCEL